MDIFVAAVAVPGIPRSTCSRASASERKKKETHDAITDQKYEGAPKALTSASVFCTCEKSLSRHTFDMPVESVCRHKAPVEILIGLEALSLYKHGGNFGSN